MANNAFLVHPLPKSGAIVLGRRGDVDVPVDDPHVSRRHVRLHLGTTIELEDLGGLNGTYVRGRRLATRERIAIAPGEAVGLGDTTIVVQPRFGDAEPVPEVDVLSSNRIAAMERIPADIVISDEKMRRLYKLAALTASSSMNVIVLGETGVGKELMAQTVHACSSRHQRPMVSLNCSAFPDSLLESELFGHDRGAFTGATRAKAGLLESADGSTVFLDEIGELSAAAQATLLRVLETGEIHRLGEVKTRRIDVRIVSATNRDLANEVRRGRFRKDLYFRLNGLTLHVPPLRDRRGEIRPLAVQFLAAVHAKAAEGHKPHLSAAALRELERYAWPGNIRELRSLIARAVLLCSEGDIRPEHLMFDELGGGGAGFDDVEISEHTVPGAARGSGPPIETVDFRSPPASGSPRGLGVKGEIDAIERQRITEAMAACGGNQTRAAKVLGIARRTLIKRLEAYGASRPRKPRAT